MDKYEYKLRSDEIKSLIREREFVKAVEIADTIDWSRVRSVNMLCTISDLYKINRRYKEAKDILAQAYERYPGGRQIVYSLCELCIKTDDVIGAIEYYKEYVQLAPMDSGKFVLQYKIYEAQDVSLEERIAVLEELKKRDYREKWGYELAYLYHRIGLGTKCVEECDQLILWFSEGKYVKKAMELKMLHQQLTQDQETLYKRMLPTKEQAEYEQQTKVYEGQVEQPVKQNIGGETVDIQVKPVDVSQYNTLNLQRELAESMKEVLVADNAFAPLYTEEMELPAEAMQEVSEPVEVEETFYEAPHRVVEEPAYEVADNSACESEIMTEVTIEETPQEMMADAETEQEAPLVVEAADEPEDVSEEPYAPGSITEAIMAPMMMDTDQLQELIINDGKIVAKASVTEEPTVITRTDSPAETEIILEADTSVKAEKAVEAAGMEAVQSVEAKGAAAAKTTDDVTVQSKEADTQIHSHNLSDTGVIRIVEAAKEPFSNMIREQVAEAVESAIREERPSIREVMQGKSTADISQVNPPEKMGRLLSEDYDGQISLVVPENEKVEKQITGQMNLEDILAEWEKTKKENEEKRKRQIQQRVLDQTGTMFTEFEAKVRDGVLEKLENNEDIDIPIAKVSEEAAVDKTTEDAVIEQVAEELPAVEELEEINEEPVNTEAEMVVETTEEAAEETVEELEELEEIEQPEEDTVSEESVREEALPQVEADTTEAGHAQTEDSKAAIESAGEESAEEDVNPQPEVAVRNMTEEEVSLFAPFVQTKGARIRLMQSLDQISLAAYTGNVFVTGETPEEAVELAKSVVKEVQMTDRNFSGKVAKVTGFSLNNRDIDAMVAKLANGALIVEMASGMDAQTTKDLLRALNQEKTGIVVVLQDTKKTMHKMMEHFSGMKEVFNVHIEVEELGDDALVAYGKKYARYLEYAIDEMGVLALHTRIDAMQTSDHIVTVADVREIVDEAIDHANRKNLRHFTDLLFAKRYDDEDMIILRERDFLD